MQSIIKLKGFPSVLAYESENFNPLEIEIIELESEEKGTRKPYFLGKIAKKHLKRYDNEEDVDTTFGFYEIDGKLYIGDKEVGIVNNYLVLVGDQDYDTDREGLWELIVAKNPDKSKYGIFDKEDYEDIMIRTNSLYNNNDKKEKDHKPVETELRPKWRRILNDIWKKRLKKGSGIITVIPSDPNALLERLDLLMASKEAGHTGVRNELVSICDELKRQRVLNAKTYKKILSIL